MAFDFDMIKGAYIKMTERVGKAHNVVGKLLALSEKVLFSPLRDSSSLIVFARVEDYIDFAPDRIASQVATSQIALLQFKKINLI